MQASPTEGATQASGAPDADAPAPRAAIDEAVACLNQGDGAGAESVLAPLRLRHPRDGDVLNLSGIAAHLLGRPEEALRLTQASVAIDPGSAVFHANHGAALAALDRPAEAAAALERSLEIRPGHAATRRNLGLALAQAGRGAQALPVLYRARELAPDDPETHLALARCLRGTGARAAAEESAQAALALDPPAALAEEARFLLANAANAPAQAPAEYVKLLFDSYAPSFDRHLREELAYRTPEALAEALAEAGARPDASADALDLGCGTGLSGLVLKPFARSLVGIDLSPRMLERAHETGVYTRLVEAMLPACLDEEAAESFDIAMAADVQIYLGATGPVFARLARLLRPGGLFALSLELMDPEENPATEMEISNHLRFRHNRPMVEASARAHGFVPVVQRLAGLRLEGGRPVEGLLLVLRRA